MTLLICRVSEQFRCLAVDARCTEGVQGRLWRGRVADSGTPSRGARGLATRAIPGCPPVISRGYGIHGQMKQRKGKGPRGGTRGPCRTPELALRILWPQTYPGKVFDMEQGTRTLRQAHNKAPAVEAMTRTSLRPGAFFFFPRHSACGWTSAPEGGEMS